MQRGNLDDLLAFMAVAQEKSFTRAAAKLGVSQSALSHTMRELEARLGVRLLTRTTRRVAPTEAGERLVQSLGPRFEEIEAEIAALSHLRDKPAGTVRITATEYAADAMLLPKLSKLLRDYPDIKVEIAVDYGLTDICHPALRCRRPQRRAGGKGHDRSAHRARHAHGSRWRAVIFQEAARAEAAAGS